MVRSGIFLAPTRRFLSCWGTGRRYRRWIVADLQRIVDKRTKAERVLALLVESGVLYIFSGVRLDSPHRESNNYTNFFRPIQAMLVASSLIRLPGSHFVLGSLYSQAAVHLAVSTKVFALPRNRSRKLNRGSTRWSSSYSSTANHQWTRPSSTRLSPSSSPN